MNPMDFNSLRDIVGKNQRSLAFARLAQGLFDQGNRADAFALLERGIQNNPAYTTAQIVYGNLLLADDKPDKAAEIFRALLAIDAFDIGALCGLTKSEFARRNFAAATACCFQILTLDPTNSFALNALREHFANLDLDIPHIFVKTDEELRTFDFARELKKPQDLKASQMVQLPEDDEVEILDAPPKVVPKKFVPSPEPANAKISDTFDLMPPKQEDGPQLLDFGFGEEAEPQPVYNQPLPQQQLQSEPSSDDDFFGNSPMDVSPQSEVNEFQELQQDPDGDISFESFLQAEPANVQIPTFSEQPQPAYSQPINVQKLPPTSDVFFEPELADDSMDFAPFTQPETPAPKPETRPPEPIVAPVTKSQPAVEQKITSEQDSFTFETEDTAFVLPPVSSPAPVPLAADKQFEMGFDIADLEVPLPPLPVATPEKLFEPFEPFDDGTKLFDQQQETLPLPQNEIFELPDKNAFEISPQTTVKSNQLAQNDITEKQIIAADIDSILGAELVLDLGTDLFSPDFDDDEPAIWAPPQTTVPAASDETKKEPPEFQIPQLSDLDLEFSEDIFKIDETDDLATKLLEFERQHSPNFSANNTDDAIVISLPTEFTFEDLLNPYDFTNVDKSTFFTDAEKDVKPIPPRPRATAHDLRIEVEGDEHIDAHALPSSKDIEALPAQLFATPETMPSALSDDFSSVFEQTNAITELSDEPAILPEELAPSFGRSLPPELLEIPPISQAVDMPTVAPKIEVAETIFDFDADEAEDKAPRIEDVLSQTPINQEISLPEGNVKFEIIGDIFEAATEDELEAEQAVTREAAPEVPPTPPEQKLVQVPADHPEFDNIFGFGKSTDDETFGDTFSAQPVVPQQVPPPAPQKPFADFSTPLEIPEDVIARKLKESLANETGAQQQVTPLGAPEVPPTPPEQKLVQVPADHPEFDNIFGFGESTDDETFGDTFSAQPVVPQQVPPPAPQKPFADFSTPLEIPEDVIARKLKESLANETVAQQQVTQLGAPELPPTPPEQKLVQVPADHPEFDNIFGFGESTDDETFGDTFSAQPVVPQQVPPPAPQKPFADFSTPLEIPEDVIARKLKESLAKESAAQQQVTRHVDVDLSNVSSIDNLFGDMDFSSPEDFSKFALEDILAENDPRPVIDVSTFGFPNDEPIPTIQPEPELKIDDVGMSLEDVLAELNQASKFPKVEPKPKPVPNPQPEPQQPPPSPPTSKIPLPDVELEEIQGLIRRNDNAFARIESVNDLEQLLGQKPSSENATVEVEHISGIQQRGDDVFIPPEDVEQLLGITVRQDFAPPKDISIESIDGIQRRSDTVFDKLDYDSVAVPKAQKEVATRTTAEIYAAQGLTQKAIDIYTDILRQVTISPEERDKIKERIDILKKRI